MKILQMLHLRDVFGRDLRRGHHMTNSGFLTSCEATGILQKPASISIFGPLNQS